MDIAKLKPIEELEMQLKHPDNGEALDVFFTVHSMQSRAYRQNLRDLVSKSMDSNEKVLVDDTFQYCVKSFRGIKENGVDIKYSPKEVVRIFEEYYWIEEQVKTFILDKANFFLKK